MKFASRATLATWRHERNFETFRKSDIPGGEPNGAELRADQPRIRASSAQIDCYVDGELVRRLLFDGFERM